MSYVFDAGVFIDIFNHIYRSSYPSFWEKFDNGINSKLIISVRDVFNELNVGNDELSDWAKDNKQIFLSPTTNEMRFVSDIFKNNHFQQIISKKARLVGKPCADPFVIAKAKIDGFCVVTTEKYKPNAANIPNICQTHSIQCTDLEGFMNRENWRF